MKVLLGIINCHSRADFQQCVRDTWLPSVPEGLDYRFFLGRGTRQREPKQDEVFLDCDDTYEGLPEKVQAMFRWALRNGYEFAVKLDDDTVLRPVEWLNTSGFQYADFIGPRNSGSRPGGVQTPYGFFYCLSREAMKFIIDAPLPGLSNNDELWVSQVLHQNGIFLRHDPRYYLSMGTKEVTLKGARPLRRDIPPPKEPVSNTFAWCVYLNWEGFHLTPSSEVIKEMKRIHEQTR